MNEGELYSLSGYDNKCWWGLNPMREGFRLCLALVRNTWRQGYTLTLIILLFMFAPSLFYLKYAIPCVFLVTYLLRVSKNGNCWFPHVLWSCPDSTGIYLTSNLHIDSSGALHSNYLILLQPTNALYIISNMGMITNFIPKYNWDRCLWNDISFYSVVGEVVRFYLSLNLWP